MATKIYEFEGTVKWAKLYEPDEFRGAVRWTLNFYPDDIDAFVKSGIQVNKKSDEDGDYFALRRPTQKVIKNDIVIFTPPTIYDEDNNPVVSYKDTNTGRNVYSYNKGSGTEVEQVGNPILFGNGSKVKVKVAIYDTAMGKGHRLESIKIVDLIEYDPDNFEEVDAPDTQEDDAKEEKKQEAKVEDRAQSAKKKLPW